MERDRAISMKSLTHRVSAECTGNFSQKNDFPPFLVAILNFCVKHKNAFISETERDRMISTKCLTHRVPLKSVGDFSQKSFSCKSGNLEFLHSKEKHVYLDNGERGVCGVHWRLFAKIIFRPLWRPSWISECKNVFISETEQRNIWNTGYLQSLVATKLFSCRFWRPSWISASNTKVCLFQKRSHIERFWQDFWPTG